jgi:hypothetical protein
MFFFFFIQLVPLTICPFGHLVEFENREMADFLDIFLFMAVDSVEAEL